MPETAQRRGARLVYLAVAALALGHCGCLVVACGVAAGGAAAAGYAYYKGSVYHDFPASLGDSLAACHAALMDMQFPVQAEENKGNKAFICSHTGDGRKVTIHLTPVTSPIPIEGTLTRVSVRVSLFGNEDVSARILDQVGRHLTPGVPLAPPVPAPAGAPVPGPTILPTSGVRPVGESAQPPLAPPEAKGTRPKQ